ncbi:hypothetical protein KFE80_11480 [bacterium SCSIO 12696]|nr:hypothetical protein KFE80_11480 [bacterium SCSIO 12696]
MASDDVPFDGFVWGSKPDPELVIGLVGAVGTDLSLVQEELGKVLDTLEYQHTEIRMSAILRELEKGDELSLLEGGCENKRIDAYMEAGDSLRRHTERGDILAILATQAIFSVRRTLDSESERGRGGCSTPHPVPRQAYILNSLKHPNEINTLRNVYGDSFLAISVYSPKSVRVEALSQKFASTNYCGSDTSQFIGEAERLVQKDAKSKVEGFGQNVSETFPLSDVFVREGKRDELKRQLTRAIETWFQYPYHTPSIDEFGLFQAHATSLRSADLSRQVGAVIASRDGEILATGCNEVPKSGGGQYWDGDEGDDREFVLGKDSSVRVKEEIVGEMLQRMSENEWLEKKKAKEKVGDLVEAILYGDESKVLKGTRLASLIEFGRIVHAEMAAISDAARRGVSLKGATLYCTTFPCHMCARHIIAAGISRVVFIEPYPKSMTKQLYSGSVLMDGESGDFKVAFESFVGVAPRRYMEFFSMPKRKDDRGKVVEWDGKTAYPRVPEDFGVYIDSEQACSYWLDKSNILGLDESDKEEKSR